MSQLFHHSTNGLARLSLFGGVFILAGLGYLGWVWAHSSYMTGESVVLHQPVPFSHDHHTAGLGIDCRYCHTSVEEAASAGIPPVQTCMNCHNIMWNREDMLAPVRDAYRAGESIPWNRVYDLPDYVYFEYTINGSDWQWQSMDEVGDNHFETTLGGLSDGDELEYAFSYWADDDWQYTDVETYTFEPA